MEEEKKIHSGEPEERNDNQQKETPVISKPDERGVRTYHLQKEEKKKAKADKYKQKAEQLVKKLKNVSDIVERLKNLKC